MAEKVNNIKSDELTYTISNCDESVAEFIYNAVRSHAALVEACEAWMECEKEYPLTTYPLTKRRIELKSQALQKTKAALALVKKVDENG